MTLAFYPFAGAEAFEVEMRSRLQVDEDSTVTVGDSELVFGLVDGRHPAVWIKSAGEAALVVHEDFVEPAPAHWED